LSSEKVFNATTPAAIKMGETKQIICC
jgi:hypothetical protein